MVSPNLHFYVFGAILENFKVTPEQQNCLKRKLLHFKLVESAQLIKRYTLVHSKIAGSNPD